MREIVLDTETTGLDPLRGDRLVEIGCVELFNRLPTGKTFHVYINPLRPMPAEAFAVHGLSEEFLSDKPVFEEIAADFLAFIGSDPLVIHNAAFDTGFLNAELERAGHPALSRERIIDTLLMARKRNPAGPNSLDALCARFGIDNSRRTKHGALLDSEILAEVYLELIGGRQTALGLVQAAQPKRTATFTTLQPVKARPTPLPARLDDAQKTAHRALVGTLGGSAIWLDYLDPEAEKPVS
jgi:DNA polymerase-3 subunit epsilon